MSSTVLRDLAHRPYSEQVRTVLLCINQPDYTGSLWRPSATVATELGLPPMRASGILRSLEAKGLAERRDPDESPAWWASSAIAERAIEVLARDA